MARLPLDTTSQRRLVDLLRVDIDAAMRGNKRAAARVDALVAENPRSIVSTYVTYNLVQRRRTWLRQHREDVHS